MATLSATPQLPPGQSPSANNYPRIQIFPCRGTLHRAPLSFPSRNSRFPSPIPISETLRLSPQFAARELRFIGALPNEDKHPAIDFTYPSCDALFQLKSQGRKLGSSLSDGAYSKMSEAIEADRTPNLFALHYEPETWRVRNLILVLRFSYSLSVIKKRNPLRPKAERHDWVGCTILLGEILQEAKILIISDGVASPAADVRKRYR
ncbi:MAG: hypothetical protein DMG45_10405 [Acidobacteria bacterium]|nr:MAG: hypothetical protein DMG45_10405 [Acidobacteriota bacterium]